MKKQSDHKKNQMLTRPSYMAVLRLAMPVILLNCTFAGMQATDAWVLGKLGSTELAAITLPSMSIFVIVSFAYSFLGIITALVGQNYGADRRELCGHYAWLGIITSVGIGVISIALWPIGSIFEFFSGNELNGLGNLESRYFKISLLALPGVLATNAIANYYLGIKRPSFVLLCSLLGLLLNFIFTYGFVFGFGPIPKIGFDGAAWATVMASGIECIVLFMHFIFAPSNRRMKTHKFIRSFKGIEKLFSSGIPAGIQGAVDVLSWGVLIVALISCYGEEALGAATILTRFMQFTFMPAEGVATTLLALVANSIGKGSSETAKEHVRICFRINSLFMLSAGILMFIFRYPLVSFFTSEVKIIEIACGSIIFISLAQWFDAMNVTYLHALQGTGDTKWTSKANIFLSAVILGVGGALAITFFKDYGSSIIWALAMIYIMFQGTLFWKRWKSNRWQNLNLLG